MLNTARMQARYDALAGIAVPANLASRVACWRSGWPTYWRFVVQHVPKSPQGQTVLDFGCEYGMLAPLLLELGAARVVGVDVWPDLEEAKPLYSGQPVSLLRPDYGYLPIPSGTIGVAILNEAISHVAKADLPVVFDELWRVMTPGGVVFISDGNGLHSETYRRGTLLPLYDILENGPDGSPIGLPVFGNTVKRCYRNCRADLIRIWYPELSSEKVEYLALNTSGLHTDVLKRAVDRFVQTGELIFRAYVPGTVPVIPSTGALEERGFYAEQVALDLHARGFSVRSETDPIRPTAPWAGPVMQSSFPDGNFCVHAVKPTARQGGGA